MPGVRYAIAAAAIVLLSGCASESGSRPLVALESATPPPDWVLVTNGAADLRMALPPWLVPFERMTSGIFANEAVAGGGQGLQLMAEGPTTLDLPPGRDEMGPWLRARVEWPGAGPGEIGVERLPAGDAVVLRRVDRAGTPQAWRLAAYAIDTPAGIAYLLIDGPPDAWEGREDDVARIAGLLQVRRGATP
jgi:hypothetical protein